MDAKASGRKGAQSPAAAIAALCAIVAVALAQRLFVPGNADVASLLTVAEKMLDGAMLYRDVLEPNPPVSVYLYAPAVLVAQIVGARPETMVAFAVFGLSFGSVAAAARLVPQSMLRTTGNARGLLLAALAVLLVLPNVAFGEREHFALIFHLPWLAVALRRANGAPVSRAAVALAASAGALTFVVKPHFALSMMFAACAAALARREWRVLFAPENLLAALLGVAILGGAFALHPQYWTEAMPLLRLLYLPARTPLLGMLAGQMPLFLIEAVALGLWFWRTRRPDFDIASAVVGASAFGFFAAAVVQGKGWPYHFYPAFGLLILLATSMAARRASGGRDLAALAIACALAAQFWMWLGAGLDMRGLTQKVRAVTERPRMISIASDFGAGFPTVREVGGEWVGRSFSRWISYNARGLAASDPQRIADYRAAEALDRRDLANDIRIGRPDVILVERRPFDFLDWARSDPAIAALLACYEPRGRHVAGAPETSGAGGVDIEIFALRAPASLVDACASATVR